MQVVAVVTALVLAALGALHLVWVASPWPLSSREEFARTVVGKEQSDVDPSFFRPATVAVAAALGAAAYLVAVKGGAVTSSAPDPLVTLGVWGVATVLLLRGLGGLVVSGLRLGDAPAVFRRLDLAAYSPLCLALGTLATAVALSSS